MKYVLSIIMIAAASLLAACNFTLASDITPPPDYVSPTAMPTLGALVPAAAPDVQNGASIFAEHCAACHGAKGLGDGPQSMQLPVTVPGVGLAEVARDASPAEWFKTVTQGNLDRFMPPFVGALTDTQRWNVISYLFTLHTTPEQIAQGKKLFDDNCTGCAAKFQDQERMASLSERNIVSLIRNGEGDLPAFAKDFTDDQAYAVAAYLRTLTFAPGSHAASAATATTPTTVSTAGSPAPATTPSTPPASQTAGEGTVSGSIQMPAGPGMTTSLQVTLHGFDHGQDASGGPQEVLTLSGTADSDGAFIFENVAMPANRIFLAEVEYKGLKYRSNFTTAEANSSELVLPALKVYEKSSDFSLLGLEQVHIYTDFATSGSVQVLEIFAFSNRSDRSVVVSQDGNTIDFIKLPKNAENVGYEMGQDSAPLIAAGNGLAVVPSETPYSIIAFYTVPYDSKLEVSQPFATDAPSIILLIPEGLKVTGSQLANKGLQVIQNNNYQEFSAQDVKAGQELSFSISGKPRASSATGMDARQITIIGGAILGLLLIGAGAFLYFRDRKVARPAADDSGFGSREEVLDAILALDDLHRAGKIADAAYQKRRNELKEILKQVS